MSTDCPLNLEVLDISEQKSDNMKANTSTVGTSITLESYLMSPINQSFSDSNPDPNQGPYDTEKWPLGTILVRGQDRYLFGQTYAGVNATFPTMAAARVMTGGGALSLAPDHAITFPDPLLKGATTITVSMIYPNLAQNAIIGGSMIFTTLNPLTGPTGEYEITSNTAGTASLGPQDFTFTLASPLNGNTADSTAPVKAELVYAKYRLWPARSLDAPRCVSIVETTATHQYAWFMTEGRATIDCVTRTAADNATGLPKMWSPQMGDQLYTLETGTAADRTAYSTQDSGKICTVETVLVDCRLSANYVLPVTPNMGITQTTWSNVAPYGTTFAGRVWMPILTSTNTPASGIANAALKFTVLQTSGKMKEIYTATIQANAITGPLGAGVNVSLVSQNSRPAIGLCKSSTIPVTAGTHQVVVALNLT